MDKKSFEERSKYIGMVNIIDILYAFVIAFMVGYFAVTPLRNTQIRHILVFAGALNVYFIGAIMIYKAKYSKVEFIRLTIIIGILVAGVILRRGGVFETVYAYLNFLVLYTILTTKANNGRQFIATKVIYLFALSLAAFLFIAYRSPSAYIFEDGRSTEALALGMTNPNFTGMMITGVIELLVISCKDRKHKAFTMLVIIGLFYLIWLTGARSSLISCALVIVYSLLFSNKKIPNYLVCACTLMPILFVPVYLTIFKSNLTNLTFMGKMLFSGRQYLYISILDGFKTINEWLFGHLGESIFFNTHNAPLMILTSVGVIGLIVAYYGFIKNLIRLNNEAQNPVNRIAIACVLSIYIGSCSEALMFTGVFPGVGFIIIFMNLAESVNNNRNLKIKEKNASLKNFVGTQM